MLWRPQSQLPQIAWPTATPAPNAMPVVSASRKVSGRRREIVGRIVGIGPFAIDHGGLIVRDVELGRRLGSITMYCLWSSVLALTVCSLSDLSLPLACARPRRRWIASITSACWASMASPSFCVQSSWSAIMASTVGTWTNDFVLSSQLCLASAAVSASPLRLVLALAQRSACTTSSG